MPTNGAPTQPASNDPLSVQRYNAFLLLVAGLGGLLYGIDVGIIGGALPYLEATSHLNPQELSIIVAAVLLGGVFSTLFAGMLADWMGRKPLMILSGAAFAASIPIIALSHGYGPLFMGRLLQGMSAGVIGIVVPLYLAECLTASSRGKGTGIFQWLLTFGIVVAALIGIYYSYRVHAVELTSNADTLFKFKDDAWRRIFWVSLPPGLLFVLGGFFVSESPRWLFRRGARDKALTALLRSRTPEQAANEIREMEETAHVATRKDSAGKLASGSLLQRKYIIPFVLTIVILACNTATGINSVIGFNTGILLQSGLSDLWAHWGYVIFTFCNFAFTIIGMTLVDRKGRRFLFILGTSGIIVAMVCVGTLFLRTEKVSVDTGSQLQPLVDANQELTLRFDRPEAGRLLANAGQAAGSEIDSSRASLAIIYSYGDFAATTSFVRSDDNSAPPIHITRADCIPDSKVKAFFSNPFATLDAARGAPLVIRKALVGSVPDASHGWLVALCLYLFVACYAMGPGVCVWIALSELMPTRIRSNGMSIALVLNQLVSATLQAIFLPFVAKHGYSSMFYLFGAFTVVYFLTVVFFLPETKGKTLEEIEAHFEGKAASSC
jgi:MFS transporter, SP family, solute carrier family 2 (myo-inositol transporter), member 13